ncbi:phenazine biosynthesis FMN-dependent oxidase PhzG [Streptomyces sp. NPDC002740]|uniref:Pyridoxamine 5'-phosphate oxidase n=1 Tax=Streptomyces asoensis TaxID=249586 RepID=A0A6M4WG52_9ACTN|nr:phenazine biosynthesis FMN-dependent oxidase PhzG [Streptomyces asoensis]QJS98977.1 pyridoxamine 5'-phosphate oxidase [Streptomyces asoensis]QJT06492.1 pyridoxamine 5'-phosphate oxidase [Streptomyces asoensis]
MTASRSESLTGTLQVPFPEYEDPVADPVVLLRGWLREARELNVREPAAMALATADARGRASVRTVVLARVTDRGLLFASHRGSRKGREMRENPWASGLLYWRETSRQVSVSGPVRRVSDAASDALWAARPVFTHAMTVASRQSEPLADAAELRERAARLAGSAPHPRPDTFVGFELDAQCLEFWSDGTDRLHERLRYERTDQGWSVTRLQP